MAFQIEQITAERLAEYARVAMVCDVRSIFAVDTIDSGLGGLRLRELPLGAPYHKDYDALPAGGPLEWPKQFDLSTWGLWIASDGGEAIGGAAVAWNVPGGEMLEGRTDLALLDDIRVGAAHRRQGVGTALFCEAARWARSKGCRWLKIETQNVNVPACRFYAKMGCDLGVVDRFAYRHQPQIANEVRLLWWLDLTEGLPSNVSS